MKTKKNCFLNVSVYGLTMDGVPTDLGRVLKDKGAQCPPRAGVFATHLLYLLVGWFILHMAY